MTTPAPSPVPQLPDQPPQLATPVDKRARKVYILWGVSISTLVALALFCWLVVVPVWQVRRAAERCDNLEMFLQDVHLFPGEVAERYQQEIRLLGDSERAAEKLTLYLRFPERFAPHRPSVLNLLGECGVATPSVLAAVRQAAKSKDLVLRQAAVEALEKIKGSQIGQPDRDKWIRLARAHVEAERTVISKLSGCTLDEERTIVRRNPFDNYYVFLYYRSQYNGAPQMVGVEMAPTGSLVKMLTELGIGE
jgi:hypothetical protein